MTRNSKQRGAALLMAMLTVTLVATFASAAMWQQWRGVEVEQAERARVQSGWILTGALDWARLILTEDGKGSGKDADFLSEPWAVPLQEAKLSTFLAAEKGVTTVASDDDSLEAFLSGEIVDLQSKLNVRNLVADGKISVQWRLSFARLFETLGLPPAQLATLAENLRFAADTSADNRSGPMASLMPQRVDQLVWLGLSPETVAVLQPYVTLLSTTEPTPVNLNTASAEVIYAGVDGLSMADAQRLVAERDRSHFQNVSAARQFLSVDPATFDAGRVSVRSSYFESRGRLRLGTITVEERSVIKREGTPIRVKALLRERGVVDTAPPGMPRPGR